MVHGKFWHSAHDVRSFSWMQRLEPPQTLHRSRRLSCSQKLDPPHVTHRSRRFPWMHFFRTRLTRCIGCGAGGDGTDAEDADAMAAGKRQMKADVGYIAFLRADIVSDPF
jgi:hypothetical protein